MKWLMLAAVLAAVPATAADPLPVVPGADGVIVIQPAEKDTFQVLFPGRTITDGNKGSATAVLRGTPKTADGSPTALITNHSADGVSGNSAVSVTIYPDFGCGTAGCRAGNTYEIILQPTDSNGNTPIANLFVFVRRKVLVAP